MQLTHATGGRQNEAFSPDPYLAGIAAATGVEAQNGAGIIAGVRHFLLYEQESNRTSGGGGGGGDGSGNGTSGGGGGGSSSGSSSVYSSNADDKTLHEVYMWPWGDAINSGAMAVMCAMPLVNGTHSCENSELLSVKLKEELGFPGFVYPDESAQFTSFDSANAGLDYSPYSDGLWSESIFSTGLANGSLTEERLDDMAIRSVLPYYFVGLDSSNSTNTQSSQDYTAYRNVRGNHSALIRQVGGEAISLLKNDNTNGGGLPLKKPTAISVYGSHAGPAQVGRLPPIDGRVEHDG
jgi:beta-glucosidase